MKLSFIDIANTIGIQNADSICEKITAYYPVKESRTAELCSVELIERLQSRFDFFGEYFELVRKCWIEIEKDELRKTYIDVTSLFMKDNSFDELCNIKTVNPDSSFVNDFFNLFIFLPSVEQAYEMYVKRGFSDAEAREYLRSFQKNLSSAHKGSLGRPAMTASKFNWLCFYIKAVIFKAGGFNFDLHTFSDAYVIKNKNSDKIAVLCANKSVHKSGYILGSCGKTDEEDYFLGSFEETDNEFIGYSAINGLYSKNKTVYSKKDWEIIMGVGDTCMGIHIPKNCDIGKDSFIEALKQAKKIVKERYSDYNPKMFTCTSWLLSVELEQMLKPNSNILNFGSFFSRYPFRDSTGNNAFNFIFGGKFNGNAEQLPEDTSLMKAYKKHLLNGNYIHMFGGVIELDSNLIK